MKKVLSLLGATILLIGLTACSSSECDEPLLDYSGNGELDASDYDTMESVEASCEEDFDYYDLEWWRWIIILY